MNKIGHLFIMNKMLQSSVFILIMPLSISLGRLLFSHACILRFISAHGMSGGYRDYALLGFAPFSGI